MSSTGQLQKHTRSHSRSRRDKRENTSKTDCADEPWGEENTSRRPGFRRGSSSRDVADEEETAPITSRNTLTQRSSSRSGVIRIRIRGRSEVDAAPTTEQSPRGVSRSPSRHPRSDSRGRREKKSTTSKKDCSVEAWSEPNSSRRHCYRRQNSSAEDDDDEIRRSSTGRAPRRGSSGQLEERKVHTPEQPVRRMSTSTGGNRSNSLSRRSHSKERVSRRYGSATQLDEAERSPSAPRVRRQLRNSDNGGIRGSGSIEGVDRDGRHGSGDSSDEESLSPSPASRFVLAASRRKMLLKASSVSALEHSALNGSTGGRKVVASSTEIAAVLSSKKSPDEKLHDTKFITSKSSRGEFEAGQKERNFTSPRNSQMLSRMERSGTRSDALSSRSDHVSVSRNRNTPSVQEPFDAKLRAQQTRQSRQDAQETDMEPVANRKVVRRRSAGLGSMESSDEESHSPPPTTRVMSSSGRRALLQKSSSVSALDHSTHNGTKRGRKIGSSFTENAAVLSLLAGTPTSSSATVDIATEEMDTSVAQSAKPAKLSAKARKAVKELQALMQ